MEAQSKDRSPVPADQPSHGFRIPELGAMHQRRVISPAHRLVLLSYQSGGSATRICYVRLAGGGYHQKLMTRFSTS